MKNYFLQNQDLDFHYVQEKNNKMTKEEVFHSDIFNLQVSWCVQSTYQFSVEWKNQFSLRIHILDYLCQSHFNCLKTDTVGP